LFQRNVQEKDITTDDTEVETGVSGGEEPKKSSDNKISRFVTGMPPPSLTGHTGYLTAATLPPVWARVNRHPQDQPPSPA